MRFRDSPGILNHSQRTERRDDLERHPVFAPTAGEASAALDRRSFVAYFSAVGLGGTLLPGALWAQAQSQQRITREMIAQAETIAGLEFTDAERAEMVRGLDSSLTAYEQIREAPLTNAIAPAVQFDPVVPGMELPTVRRPARISPPKPVVRPATLEEAAFWSVRDLAELIRTRQVTSVELTQMYLDRLERHGPRLEAVITLTEERAMALALRADADLAAGRYHGPLHGVPWAAKDLLAVRGYRTTWGAQPYVEQTIDVDAAVVERLDAAGAGGSLRRCR